MNNMPTMPTQNQTPSPKNEDVSLSEGEAFNDASPSEGLNPPVHATKTLKPLDPPVYENVEEQVSSNVTMTPKPVSGIEVIAVLKGFYGNRRINEGQTFIIRNEKELGKWMQCTDPKLQKAHEERMKNQTELLRKRAEEKEFRARL